jgi:hypothetical protein
LQTDQLRRREFITLLGGAGSGRTTGHAQIWKPQVKKPLTRSNAALGDGHMTHSRQRRRDNHEQLNNN